MPNTGTQGLIFVIDSNDRARIDEARQELHRIINDREMKDSLLLVFANKQDMKEGRSSLYMGRGRDVGRFPWFSLGEQRTPYTIRLAPRMGTHADRYHAHSYETSRGYRGPATLQVEGQGLVRCAVLRDHRRGPARWPSLAVQQRQGPSRAGEKVDKSGGEATQQDEKNQRSHGAKLISHLWRPFCRLFHGGADRQSTRMAYLSPTRAAGEGHFPGPGRSVFLTEDDIGESYLAAPTMDRVNVSTVPERDPWLRQQTSIKASGQACRRREDRAAMEVCIFLLFFLFLGVFHLQWLCLPPPIVSF